MLPIIVQASNVNETISGRSTRMIKGNAEIVFLLNRLKNIEGAKILLATTSDAKDDELATAANQLGIHVFRGQYADVLSRLLEAAKDLECQSFVRVYGNYPLVDIEWMKKLVDEHEQGGFQYSYNEHRNGVLWGLGCEVFRVDLLKELDSILQKEAQRETVGFYVQQNCDRYKVNKQYVCKKRPEYRLYFETEKDLDVIREICDNVDELSNEAIIRYMDSHGVLARYNLENPAKEVGTEKLFLHTAKTQDILDNQVMANSYPISVELTLTNMCNLRCVYCSDQDLRERQGCKNMEFCVFERLFQDLANGGTKGVVFEGGGEPTLHPQFEQLIEAARKYGLAVGLITNGTKNIKPEVVQELEWIRVSLDASNAEEYHNLKKVNCFEDVIANIAHYAKYCKTVGVGYVVTNQNMSNIETLILRLRDLGASYIQMRPVVDNPALSPNEKDLKYLEFYRNGTFNVIVDGMKENAQGGNAGLPCYASSITSIISGDGSVYLCGRLNIYDWLQPIGNIKNQTFHEIWNGSERKKQLEMIKNKEFCSKNCPQCRVSKYNELFERLLQTKSVHFI